MKDTAIHNLNTATILQLFAQAYKDSGLDNPEAMLVGTRLVSLDSWVLGKITDASSLEARIIKMARARGNSYADLSYIPETFLDPDDDDFEQTDGGDLSWVPWKDLYLLLENFCKLAETHKGGN